MLGRIARTTVDLGLSIAIPAPEHSLGAPAGKAAVETEA